MNFPILSSLILLPTIGALFIFFVRSSNSQYQSSKYVALFITLANFFLSLYLWIVFDKSIVDFQFVEEREWISGFVNYHSPPSRSALLVETKHEFSGLIGDLWS